MTRNTDTQTRFDTERVLTPAERTSISKLTGIANAHIIDKKTSRQTAIDALSIVDGLITANTSGETPGDIEFGIAPGNVPEHALPPSYDTETKAMDR